MGLMKQLEYVLAPLLIMLIIHSKRAAKPFHTHVNQRGSDIADVLLAVPALLEYCAMLLAQILNQVLFFSFLFACQRLQLCVLSHI